jgi:hypothetical protein
MSSSGAKGLRPCKRYIATHDSTGKSIYADSPAQVYNYNPGFGGMARSYSVGSVPANLADDADVIAYRSEDAVTSYKRREIVLPQPGSNLVVVDLEPGASSLMHQTVSIDYSICCVGEIDHELDGGEKVRLYPGVSIYLSHATSNFPRLGADSQLNRITLSSEERCIAGRTPRMTSRRDLWLVVCLVPLSM